jgi:hypothetical protein
MWHKARSQPGQGVTGRPHHLGQLSMSWCISKNRFAYVSKRGSAQGIQCPKLQVGNLVARPDKWATHAQSSARAPPYSSYKYHGAPPSRKCEESEV